MPEGLSRRNNSFHRLWRFVRRQIVDDLPEELVICEFDCRKGQCQQDQWETCDRRIRKGAGEFFPDARLAEPHPSTPVERE